MGMDVYGKKPDSKEGEYFRNSVWSWHPLWNYCRVVAEIAGTVKHGHSNDGDGLTKKASLALAKVLRDELASGRTKAYAEEYAARMAAMPDVECDLCKGAGFRSDEYAVKNLPETTKPGGCNACEGKGKVRPFDSNYPFDVENVEEFALFLEHCGGFEIW